MSNIKNSDILFLYDAKMCNPNGDPDDENRPRMDYARSRNLVSDVRLKRYIRDYLAADKGMEIFVGDVEGKTVNATERIKELFKNQAKADINKLTKEQVEWMLDQLADVRLFGATMPIKGKDDKEGGSSNTFTGPVQFNWGYSLHETELIESNTITSHFSSESTKGQGTFGKDYRVYYSLIGFHGIINGRRAVHTRMTEDDVNLLDEALLKAIPLQATRSKIGQYPRFFLRIEYNCSTYIGDLRRYVKVNSKVADSKIRELEDFELDFTGLVKVLDENKAKIEKIYCWQDRDLKPHFKLDGELAGKLQKLNY